MVSNARTIAANLYARNTQIGKAVAELHRLTTVPGVDGRWVILACEAFRFHKELAKVGTVHAEPWDGSLAHKGKSECVVVTGPGVKVTRSGPAFKISDAIKGNPRQHERWAYPVWGEVDGIPRAWLSYHAIPGYQGPLGGVKRGPASEAVAQGMDRVVAWVLKQRALGYAVTVGGDGNYKPPKPSVPLWEHSPQVALAAAGMDVNVHRFDFIATDHDLIHVRQFQHLPVVPGCDHPWLVSDDTMTAPIPDPGDIMGYDKADRETQWFGDTFTGSRIDPNVVVWHTTETMGWPPYVLSAKGTPGESAPHYTTMPVFAKVPRLAWRQHYDETESARALRNEAGGVETNTLNCLQVEMIGTCDPGTRDKWRRAGHKQDVDFIFWPEAPEWALRQVAEFVADQWKRNGIKLEAPALWLAYPLSYGQSSARFTGKQWTNFYGHCGHQHVPENCVHPDTLILAGDLTWVRAGDLQTGDRLVGFDEENVQVGSTPGRRFREAFATVHGTVSKDSYRVTMADGRQVTASADHKWLVNLPYVNRGSRIAWVETQNLDPASHRIKSLGVDTWTRREDSEAGYLAGAIDCDGAVVFNQKGDASVLFGQADDNSDVLARFTDGVIAAKLDYYELSRGIDGSGIGSAPFTDIRVKGGLWRIVKFLAEVGSAKFERVRDNCWVNRVIGKTTTTAEIRSIEHVGLQPVVSLETSTGTYVAAGMLCHNTHGDPGAFPMDTVLRYAKEILAPKPPKLTKVEQARALVQQGVDGLNATPEPRKGAKALAAALAAVLADEQYPKK